MYVCMYIGVYIFVLEQLNFSFMKVTLLLKLLET